MSLHRALTARLAVAGRRAFQTSAAARVTAGQAVPATTLFNGSPGNAFPTADLVPGSLLVFVPGAFSPACSASHVPGYLGLADEFAKAAVPHIYVVAVNDSFVVKSWAESLGAADDKRVTFLADPAGDLTAALDLKFDAAKFFGNDRAKRSAVLLGADGAVRAAWVEPTSTGVEDTAADKILAAVKAL
ncbi:Redoxin [Dipodascopsis tothii]|uniref:Redoxin n=1 Tax=Dipodascopsis tothii TaxID=44089 RepID=UPI0034CF7739